MTDRYSYDTVAFDVRDNTTMLFFAKTSKEGEIVDYLLLMRSVEADFEESFFIEINEKQIDGNDLLEEARLMGNTLTLVFRESVPELDGASELTLSFDATENNLSSLESGAFRVLGEHLKGGNA